MATHIRGQRTKTGNSWLAFWWVVLAIAVFGGIGYAAYENARPSPDNPGTTGFASGIDSMQSPTQISPSSAAANNSNNSSATGSMENHSAMAIDNGKANSVPATNTTTAPTVDSARPDTPNTPSVAAASGGTSQ